uniref:bifunctional DNA primase/helicase n=1 Tax=Yoonia sp. TaxID=2212373 RepID=UPI004048D800
MKEIFNWSEIPYGGVRVGNKRSLCPKCSHTRSKKKDPCLSINFDKGLANCHNCQAVSFKEEVSYEKTSYVEPPQDWENHTALSEGMVKWCAERSIPQRTLIDFGITEEKQWLPQTGKEANCIVFNYFEGSKLVNKKFRDSKKNFTQSKDGKKILYNINAAIGQETLYIVEGEFDVLAMHSQGFENVVSLRNGANDHDEQWINSEKYISDVKKFIIATDNDEKGLEVRAKIAHRLGKYRCSFIDWQHKDANGSLQNGTFDKDIRSEQRFPVSGTFHISDLKEDILGLYNNGLPKTIAPLHHSMSNLRKIFSVMRGHMVTVTGIPSSGKSNFVEWYVLNLVYDYGMKASFFSPEHQPMSLHQSTFIEKAVGRNFWNDKDGQRITKTDIDRYVDWADEKIYVTSPERGEAASWDWLLEKFNEQLFSYGIDIFVIDAFNKVSLPSGNRLDAINEVLTKITAFAQSNDVIVILVAHPTKMKKNESGKYEVPTLYDVSGSADFRNQTHDGFSIHRVYEDLASGEEGCTEFHNMKTKYKFQGIIGDYVRFKYHIPTGRYYEEGNNPPLFDMTIPKQEQYLDPIQDNPIIHKSAMKPNEAFYDIDDIEDDPF